MRATIVLAAAALALAGCQSAEEKHAAETGEIEVTNAKTDEVSRLIKAAAPKTAVKPGLWKAELRIEAVDVGPNGDSAQQLRLAKSLERSATECKTAEQLKLLRELGCDVAQGFFVARPLEPDALKGWIVEWRERWENLVDEEPELLVRARRQI